MILPILPRFVVDLKSIEFLDDTVYFNMKLGISEINCFCQAESITVNDTVSPTMDCQDDQDIEFESLAVSNEYDKETTVEIEDSTEDNLVGLTIGLTDKQVEAINKILNEQFLEQFIGA